jgi:hypothetical protein
LVRKSQDSTEGEIAWRCTTCGGARLWVLRLREEVLSRIDRQSND